MCKVLPTQKLCAPTVAFLYFFVSLCFRLTHTCAVGPPSIGCLLGLLNAERPGTCRVQSVAVNISEYLLVSLTYQLMAFEIKKIKINKSLQAKLKQKKKKNTHTVF